MTARNRGLAPVGPGPPAEHILTVDCAESPGIVHAVSGFLLDHGCDILDIKQYGDKRATALLHAGPLFLGRPVVLRAGFHQHRGPAPRTSRPWPRSGQ